ncbi:MAG: hypothetical protein NDJ90_12275 [Oligoflexia bacterium]|nr:hypothetical protein [Oligoflexia bacterium]
MRNSLVVLADACVALGLAPDSAADNGGSDGDVGESQLRVSPDGMVSYDHVVEQNYGYYDVYLPMLKGSDGRYYVFSRPEEEVQKDSFSYGVLMNAERTDAICASLGLSRNAHHSSTWEHIEPGESYVYGPFETPRLFKESWWKFEDAKKLVVLHCEDIYDVRRVSGFPGPRLPRLIVRGGTISIPVP